MARVIFDLAARQGVTLTLLDIGGGFPGWDGSECVYDKATGEEEAVGSSRVVGSGAVDGGEDGPPPLSLAQIAEVTIPVLDELFPPNSGVKVRENPVCSSQRGKLYAVQVVADIFGEKERMPTRTSCSGDDDRSWRDRSANQCQVFTIVANQCQAQSLVYTLTYTYLQFFPYHGIAVN